MLSRFEIVSRSATETSSGRLSNAILYFEGWEVRSFPHPLMGEKHGEIVNTQHLFDKSVFSKALHFYCLATRIAREFFLVN